MYFQPTTGTVCAKGLTKAVIADESSSPTSASDVCVWFPEGGQVVSVVAGHTGDFRHRDFLPSLSLGTLNHLSLRGATILSEGGAIRQCQ